MTINGTNQTLYGTVEDCGTAWLSLRSDWVDGYKFDGFAIHASAKVPSIAELADDALGKALQGLSFPLADRVSEGLAAARRHFSEPDYDAVSLNLRLVLKYTLEGIARALENETGTDLPSDRENEVRDYLEKRGFLSKEETKGLAGIYGLLSTGPYGKANQKSALLSYAASVMACSYAITKFEGRDRIE